MIRVYFDGSCEPVNPGGNGAIGAVAYDGEFKLKEISLPIGSGPLMSNNVAEYKALSAMLAFLEAYKFTKREIICYGDSMMVIKQMSGKWKVKSGLYKEAALSCREIGKRFSNIKYQWIPREKNQEADRLSHPNQFARLEVAPNPAAKHCPTCGQSLKNSSNLEPGPTSDSRKAVRSPCAGLADQHGTKGIEIPILE